MQEIIINDKSMTVKEYQGQRVVTLKDIDTVHNRIEGTARKRFNDNRKRFLENTDYFVLNSDEARKAYNIQAPNGLILITETGYLMLVKSFTDTLAWNVQRQLVNSYFKIQSLTKHQELSIQKQKIQGVQLSTLKTLDYIFKRTDLCLKNLGQGIELLNMVLTKNDVDRVQRKIKEYSEELYDCLDVISAISVIEEKGKMEILVY